MAMSPRTLVATEDRMETPNINWTFALEDLARFETKFIRDFFRETDQHFQRKLSKLRIETERNGLASDDDVEWYVNLRDELEWFGQLNRYFTIVQAYSLIERCFARVVKSAIDYGILNKSILGRLKFPNTTVVKKGFQELGITLPGKDEAAFKKLADKRHTILHSGGWFQSEKKRKGKLAPMLLLEFAEADVESALDLALRCTKSAVCQYRTFLLGLTPGPEQASQI